MAADEDKGSDTKDDVLTEAQEAFKLASDQESDNRAEAIEDLRFARLGEQWPANIKEQRARTFRPCLTINRMPSFIRQVVNDARQNKPQMKVRPVDSGADIKTADVMSGLIRNIEYTSNADIAYDTAADFAVTMGWGYFRIDIQYAHDDSFDQDLVIQRIANPLSIYADPFSTAADSSDWNSAFVTDLIPKDEFKRRWKGADEIDWDDLGYSKLRPPWMEGESILIAEWWTREEVQKTILQLSDGRIIDEDEFNIGKDALAKIGVQVVNSRETKSFKVRQKILTGAEVLDEKDWPGRYIPIVPVYGDEVNVEGKRYLRSLIRDAKDPQRMFNFWRTASTERIALAPKTPFIGPTGAFETDAHKWDTANTDTHSFIQYDGQVAPARQGAPGPSAGELQEALNANSDMEQIIGLEKASLGQQGNERTGKAIMARQREGDVSTFHFIDNLSRAIRHGGRILIDLIPHVYSGERVLRVLGEDGTPQNVPVNQPVIAPQGQPGMTPPPPQPVPKGMPAPPEATIYNLTAGKYDLTVEAGPSYTTRRQEAAEQYIQLLQAFPQAAPFIGDIIAKNLDLPGAQDIADRFKMLMQQHSQGQPDPNASKVQAAQINAQADVQIAQIKGQIDKEIAQMKAQTDAQIKALQFQMEAALRAREQNISAVTDMAQHHDRMNQPTPEFGGRQI